jgi:hypothetical protein
MKKGADWRRDEKTSNTFLISLDFQGQNHGWLGWSGIQYNMHFSRLKNVGQIFPYLIVHKW